MGTYNIAYCRNRHRKDSVLTADRSASLAKSRNDHFLHIQIIHTHRYGKNIPDGIHCTYLMEMYLICRYIMGFRLCCGKNSEDFFRIRSGTVCHVCMINDCHDLVESAMLMVMMSVMGM